MIAVVFAAVPTAAETSYTGTVIATDGANAPKTEYVQGEHVYFDVFALFNGNIQVQAVTVRLMQEPGDLNVLHLHANTNGTTGWYNSSTAAAPQWFDTTFLGIAGTVQPYDIVAFNNSFGDEIARAHITVKKAGLTLDPASHEYFPGQQITWTLVTTHKTETLNAQIHNATFVHVYSASVTPSSGWAQQSLNVGTDWKDGVYFLTVSYASNDTLVYAGVMGNVTFFVSSYSFEVSAERDTYLPGETANISYLVVNQATLAPAAGVTITYIATWWTHVGNRTVLNYENGTLSASENVQHFLVRADTALNTTFFGPAINIDYWANATNRSQFQNVHLHVDVIHAEVFTGSMGAIRPRSLVGVNVQAMVDDEDLPGASVSVVVLENGTTPVEAYGATGLITDESGTAVYVFTLANNTKLGSYVVQATVSKVGHTTMAQAVFTVGQGGFLVASLDKTSYYAGEIATLSFRTVWNNQDVEVGTIFYKVSIGGLLFTSGNTTSKEATFALPSDRTGAIEVDAQANYAGFVLDGTADSELVFALMELSLAKDSYRPGETITWNWNIVSGLSSANLVYQIIDDDGVIVAQNEPSFAKTGQITFKVPSDMASPTYEADLIMTTPEGGAAEASAQAHLVASYELKVSVKKSSYADGLYAPGQKIQINYVIASYVFSQRPAYRIHLTVDFDPVELDIVTTTASGHITYTIPKDAPMAQAEINAQLFDATGGPMLSGDTTAFTVGTRQSAWDLSVGGMSLIDLVLLVLLIVVVIALIVWPWVKHRQAMAPKPPETMAPPMPEQGKAPPPSP